MKRETIKTGLASVDNLFGYGIVVPSVTLLAGDPGIGKSTLLLKIAKERGIDAVYFSTEDTGEYSYHIMKRLGLDRAQAFGGTTNRDEIKKIAVEKKAKLVMIDDIDGMVLSGEETRADVIQDLRNFCEQHHLAVIVSCHGKFISCREKVQHGADAVAVLRQGDPGNIRVLSVSKNRFAPVTDRVAAFVMSEKSFSEITV